jgi:CPA1 family monovalent cation:H+ antiporter
MDALELTGVVLALTTLLTYCSLRFLRMPHPIGAMVLALGVSAGLIVLDHLSLPVGDTLKKAVGEIDYRYAVLRWMLGFLLFAGGLTIRLDDLIPQQRRVVGLAILGTFLFIIFAGFATGSILPHFHLPVTLLGAMAFAALIAPTNPGAISDFLQSSSVPQRVKTVIVGESIFSAAVVSVVFFILVGAAVGDRELTASGAAFTFLVQDGGAILLGLSIGLFSLWLVGQVDQPHYTVLTSVAAVVGGYALADRLGMCGPVVVACAGLCLGNPPAGLRVDRVARDALVSFWGPVEYGLNTMLFVLLGLEMLVIEADERLSYVAVGVFAIWPVVLLARLASVWLVSRLEDRRPPMRFPELAALTWGGPRGGISLALAMVLPPGPERSCWIAVTYVVVLLSIVVQGLTLKRLITMLERGETRGRPAKRMPETPPTPV